MSYYGLQIQILKIARLQIRQSGFPVPEFKHGNPDGTNNSTEEGNQPPQGNKLPTPQNPNY